MKCLHAGIGQYPEATAGPPAPAMQIDEGVQELAGFRRANGDDLERASALRPVPRHSELPSFFRSDIELARAGQHRACALALDLTDPSRQAVQPQRVRTGG